MRKGGEIRKEGRQAGRKEGRKKTQKCKKSARTRWCSKIGKSFVCAFTRKRKEEEEERMCRGKSKIPQGETRLGTMEKMTTFPFSVGTKNVRCKRCC